MPPKKKKPEQHQLAQDINNSTAPEDTQFLLTVAENAVRDAIVKSGPLAHGTQMHELAQALLQLQGARHAFTHPPEWFDHCEDDV